MIIRRSNNYKNNNDKEIQAIFFLKKLLFGTWRRFNNNRKLVMVF